MNEMIFKQYHQVLPIYRQTLFEMTISIIVRKHITEGVHNSKLSQLIAKPQLVSILS